MKEEAEAWRTRLIEAVIDQDDAAMEAYLEGTEPDAATLKTCIRNAAVSFAVGAGAERLGIQEQGRPAIARCGGRFPAGRRIEVLPVRGVLPGSDEQASGPSSDDAPFSALAFKIMTDPFVGYADLRAHLFRQHRDRLVGAEHA